MTIQEAVYLVLLGTTLARGGDILILDMGDPVNIYDLVRTHAQALNSKSVIEIGHLRDGENESEKLYSESEKIEPTAAPNIWRLVSKKTPIPVNFEIGQSNVKEQIQELLARFEN